MTEGQDDGEANDVDEGGVADAPNESADPRSIVEAAMPQDILDRYEVHSYRSAAMILSQGHVAECAEPLAALRRFSIPTQMIRTAGGNEREIPKLFNAVLRRLGWHETSIHGDLLLTLNWREQTRTTRQGTPVCEKRKRELRRKRFPRGADRPAVRNGAGGSALAVHEPDRKNGSRASAAIALWDDGSDRDRGAPGDGRSSRRRLICTCGCHMLFCPKACRSCARGDSDTSPTSSGTRSVRTVAAMGVA